MEKKHLPAWHTEATASALAEPQIRNRYRHVCRCMRRPECGVCAIAMPIQQDFERLRVPGNLLGEWRTATQKQLRNWKENRSWRVRVKKWAGMVYVCECGRGWCVCVSVGGGS